MWPRIFYYKFNIIEFEHTIVEMNDVQQEEVGEQWTEEDKAGTHRRIDGTKTIA